MLLSKLLLKGSFFYFINVYAPNLGHERIIFFNILSNVLKQDFSDGNIIGGHWNCTEKFTVDRVNEEPHMPSSIFFVKINEGS